MRVGPNSEGREGDRATERVVWSVDHPRSPLLPFRSSSLGRGSAFAQCGGEQAALAMFIEGTDCANTRYAFDRDRPQQKDAFPIRTLRVRQEFDATPQTQHGGYASGKGGRGAAAAAGPVTECRGSLHSG